MDIMKKVLYVHPPLATSVGLNANALKLIAILAMVVDHCAILFVEIGTPAEFWMHAVGRLTAPIMCFFIAEGYHYTSNLKRYMRRLLVIALVSHVAHALCFGFSVWQFWRATSVMWSLFLGLAALAVFEHKTLWLPLRVLVVGLCCLLAFPGNWNYIAVLWILAFGVFKNNNLKKWIAFTAVAVLYVLQYFIHGATSSIFIRFFVLAAIPLLLLYNHTLGRKSKLIQWGYYLFYPAHLMVLYLINLAIR